MLLPLRVCKDHPIQSTCCPIFNCRGVWRGREAEAFTCLISKSTLLSLMIFDPSPFWPLSNKPSLWFCLCLPRNAALEARGDPEQAKLCHPPHTHRPLHPSPPCSPCSPRASLLSPIMRKHHKRSAAHPIWRMQNRTKHNLYEQKNCFLCTTHGCKCLSKGCSKTSFSNLLVKRHWNV